MFEKVDKEDQKSKFDLKIIFYTVIATVCIFIITVTLVFIGNFDNRSNAAVQIVSIPKSIYATNYLLNSDQSVILSKNNNLKASLVNSVNNLKLPTNTTVNVIDLIELDNAEIYVSIFQTNSTSVETTQDGYLSGQVYKYVYALNKIGQYDYIDSDNISGLKSLLLNTSSYTKLASENLSQLDDIVYEGDTTLFQNANARATASSVSGVSFKFPWNTSMGDWKISQSWHNSSWYLNGGTYTETALDIVSPLFNATYETANETAIYAPISGTIQSRCNYDPYNNGYLVIRGDDGVYYSIIHLKVSTITVNTGSRVTQGKLLGYLFEDGSNQDRWVAGQSTSGRCAWAQGTHIHIGAIPVNNNNLVGGVRTYTFDNVVYQYPNNNGNASVGKTVHSSMIPSNTNSSSSSSTTTSVVNKFTIKPKLNLNIRKCSSTTSINGVSCIVLGAATSGKIYPAVCKYLSSTSTASNPVYWVRIDTNALSSTTNNQWISGGSTYIFDYINNVEVQVTDSRIPNCPSGI